MLARFKKHKNKTVIGLDISLLNTKLCWVDKNLSDADIFSYIKYNLAINDVCFDYEVVDCSSTRQQLHIYWCSQQLVVSKLKATNVKYKEGVIVETSMHALSRAVYKKFSWSLDQVMQMIIFDGKSLFLSLHKNDTICFFQSMCVAGLTTRQVLNRLMMFCEQSCSHKAVVCCATGIDVKGFELNAFGHISINDIAELTLSGHRMRQL